MVQPILVLSLMFTLPLSAWYSKRALALAPLVLDSVDDEGIENRTVNREIARECAQNG